MKRIAAICVFMFLNSCGSGAPAGPELTELKSKSRTGEGVVYENYSTAINDATNQAFIAMDSIFLIKDTMEVLK